MTEQEWLACADPQEMLGYLRGKATDRKLRLFAVACCRRAWQTLGHPRGAGMAEVAERFADGLATAEELEACRNDAVMDLRSADGAPEWAGRMDLPPGCDNSFMEAAACDFTSEGAATESLSGHIRSAYPRTAITPAPLEECALLRDIFGPLPFRLVAIAPAVLAWHDGTIPKLAQAISDDRAFDGLPVLADALEEAGCDNADILNHCRRPGEHVRGCWPVDLILGKT